MPKQQSPMEIRARALEDAADAFDMLQDAPGIAWDDLLDVDKLQASADFAIEEPSNWMREKASRLRDGHELTLGYVAEYKAERAVE